MSNHLPRIAITCGDPSGVGPEIIAAWAHAQEQMEDVCILGPGHWLEQEGLSGIAVGAKDYKAIPGEPDPAGARLAWEAMKMAAQGCVEGRFRAVVTGPVSKSCLAGVGYPFPGQTEFFADAWGGHPTMGFVGKRMRVVLATWHQPLMTVGPTLHKYPELIQRAVERAAWLAKRAGAPIPRIAVCGLNPHAGEEGLLGTEEKEWLNPLLQKLQCNYPGLSLALPADTVFHRHLHGDFDVVVALYHDQGLGPLKTLEFDSAVNVSLGLPFIRTSPDHGTAFGIAGSGTAHPGSFTAAIDWARRLSMPFEDPTPLTQSAKL